MANDIFDGIELQSDGTMSPRDAKMVRLRLQKKIENNSKELALLIEQLTKLLNEMTNAASIEFFVEDVE